MSINDAPASPSSGTFSNTMGWYPLRLKKLPKTGPAMPQPMMSTTGGDIVVFVLFTTADLEIGLLIVMTWYIAGDLHVPPCGDEASSPVFNFHLRWPTRR